MSDVIKIENATKVIKDRTVLDGISLELPRGGVCGFMGINGSGKTMLFRAVAGLIHLSSGSVSVFGRRIGKDCDFPPNLGLSLDSTGFWKINRPFGTWPFSPRYAARWGNPPPVMR